MIINNAINAPLPTSLTQGGTGAALVANTGGIFYSTSNTAAILNNTATVSCGLLSGSSTTPFWSTATYPAITNVNKILYSSSANTIGGLTSASNAALITDPTDIPTWQTLTDGQVIIGSTGATPVAANLIAGTDTSITNGAGTITINSIAGGTANWQWIATQTASSSLALNFDNSFSSDFVAYRIVLVNLLPSGTAPQLYLQFGIGSLPTYVSTNTYIYQVLDAAGGIPDYPGYFGSGFGFARLTWGGGFSGNGVSTDPTYGGICGDIDLFVTAGSINVANGISNLSYESYNDLAYYVNTTSSFQLPADNFTSVQLISNGGGNNFLSGTAYLYGLSE